jgi:hypothetical protein
MTHVGPDTFTSSVTSSPMCKQGEYLFSVSLWSSISKRALLSLEGPQGSPFVLLLRISLKMSFEHCWNHTDRRRPNFSEKNLSYCHSFHQGQNPGRHGEGPASNRLGHGTAVCNIRTFAWTLTKDTDVGENFEITCFMAKPIFLFSSELHVLSDNYMNCLNVKGGKQGIMTGTSIVRLNGGGKVMCDKEKEIQVRRTLCKLICNSCLPVCTDGGA